MSVDSYYVDYNEVWKWFYLDWWWTQNVFWEDFNFASINNLAGGQYDTLVYDITSSFNLSWFQPWHEVAWCWMRFKREWQWSTSSYKQYFHFWFLRSKNWSNWEEWWNYDSYINWPSVSYESWTQWLSLCWYVWIDDDEIRDWYPYYKFHVQSNDWEYKEDSTTFTVSNLSIDSTLHNSWYLWVQWSHLCYTDWTWFEMWNPWYWYKHAIAYDGNFSEYVWTSYSWAIWLERDVIRRIYYIDQYWYKRRTYEASNWYWYPNGQWYRPSSSVPWRIWCPWNYDYAEDWYWHLCFVNQNWYLMRILNWPPWWVA